MRVNQPTASDTILEMAPPIGIDAIAMLYLGLGSVVVALVVWALIATEHNSSMVIKVLFIISVLVDDWFNDAQIY
jgi:hypothetical protein